MDASATIIFTLNPCSVNLNLVKNWLMPLRKFAPLSSPVISSIVINICLIRWAISRIFSGITFLSRELYAPLKILSKWRKVSTAGVKFCCPGSLGGVTRND